MAREQAFLERLAQHMDLPGEAVPGQSIVEILGDSRVLIEKHRGMFLYSCEKIGVKVSFGSIMICGRNLELCTMSRDQLIITGCIDGISLCRRRNP